MRSYGQYCGLAKALDVVGDRWSLLIVRELLLRDACRYTDLRDGLPGIATNLLADRLRDLEGAGIVEREEAPPPVATTLFRLTERGRELRPAVHALGHWGGPMLGDDFGDDAFRSHWLALPVEIHLGDRVFDGPPVTIGVHAGREDLLVELADGRVRTREWRDEVPEVTIGGAPRLLLALLIGRLDLDTARDHGLEVAGDASVLRRVFGGDAGATAKLAAAEGA
ncbi:MAG: winged helix-turn-helix transcriptional regulator [Gaiellaceae bacterium]